MCPSGKQALWMKNLVCNTYNLGQRVLREGLGPSNMSYYYIQTCNSNLYLYSVISRNFDVVYLHEHLIDRKSSRFSARVFRRFVTGSRSGLLGHVLDAHAIRLRARAWRLAPQEP